MVGEGLRDRALRVLDLDMEVWPPGLAQLFHDAALDHGLRPVAETPRGASWAPRLMMASPGRSGLTL